MRIPPVLLAPRRMQRGGLAFILGLFECMHLMGAGALDGTCAQLVAHIEIGRGTRARRWRRGRFAVGWERWRAQAVEGGGSCYASEFTLHVWLREEEVVSRVFHAVC